MEEPNEPPNPCTVRVLDGYRALEPLLDRIKRAVYKYNSVAAKYGYYLKPVHRVYKRVGDRVRVFEYYGRYWWRIEGGRKKRLVYAGSNKPAGVPQPPRIPLLGLAIAREGDDVILDCETYARLSSVFKGYKAIFNPTP